MGQAISLPFKLLQHTRTYVSGFLHFLCGKGRTAPYDKASFAPLAPKPSDAESTRLFKQNARIHLFGLASNFYLYNLPHYRKPSYREDLADNLRNVAIPGTGIPLSWTMARTRLLAAPVLLTCYPAVSLVASVHYWIRTRGKSSISEEYAKRLLAPDDWFNYWRLNCAVVGLHSLLHDMPEDYGVENKWTFLEKGEKLGVPVSPFLKTGGIVVKHKNEEGGMGIHFFKNAVDGGDWIIQERIDNSAFVSALLPTNAPLSTFRVITYSRAAIDMQPRRSAVRTLSCVFRAGRQGAATDHDSILFDVNVKTGEILRGTTNANWYRLWGTLWFTLPCVWASSSLSHMMH